VLHRAEELREAALIDENGGIQQTDGDHSGPHAGGDFGSVSFEHDAIDEELRRDDGPGYVADQEDAHGSAADQTNDSGSAVYLQNNTTGVNQGLPEWVADATLTEPTEGWSIVSKEDIPKEGFVRSVLGKLSNGMPTVSLVLHTCMRFTNE
jgi:hypothetical protein